VAFEKRGKDSCQILYRIRSAVGNILYIFSFTQNYSNVNFKIKNNHFSYWPIFHSRNTHLD